jgi:hypothetical protein
MAKFAVTLSNGKIVYPVARTEIAARDRVQTQINDLPHLELSITSIRKVSGR